MKEQFSGALTTRAGCIDKGAIHQAQLKEIKGKLMELCLIARTIHHQLWEMKCVRMCSG